MTLLLVLLILLALMLSGIPVAFAIGVSAIIGLYSIGGGSLVLGLLETTPITQATSPSLAAVPLYLLMAHFVLVSGIGDDLFEALRVLLGRVPASLGIATVGGGALFGAMSGSTVASASVYGKSAYPPLVARGYSPKLATGVISVSGTLAVMVPPSLALIFYAFMAQVSVGSMLVAGLVPGVLTALLIVAVLLVMAWRRPDELPAGQRYPWREKARAMRSAVPLFVLFLVVTLALYSGIATTNESAAVGAAGAFLIGLGRRRLSLRKVYDALVGSAVTTTMVITVIIAAYLFGYFLTLTRMTPRLVGWVSGLEVPTLVILVAICLFYMLMGTFMDEAALMFLTVPVLVPVVEALGADLVWFGVMIVLMQQIGLLSPPLGLTVFVVSRVTNRPTQEVFAGAWPFVVAMLGLVLVFLLVPGIVTWLPERITP